jgi:hypothetical protein
MGQGKIDLWQRESPADTKESRVEARQKGNARGNEKKDANGYGTFHTWESTAPA